MSNKLSELLSKINFEKISSESNDFSELEDGYYLSEVESVEFTTSKTSGADMLKWQFKIVENGIKFNDDLQKEYIEGSVNRKIFMFHVLKDDVSVKRMLSDLLKFEDENGESILNSDFFINQEVLEEAIQLLVGKRIFIHLDTDKNQNQWKRMCSWSGAAKLELV